MSESRDKKKSKKKKSQSWYENDDNDIYGSDNDYSKDLKKGKKKHSKHSRDRDKSDNSEDWSGNEIPEPSRPKKYKRIPPPTAPNIYNEGDEGAIITLKKLKRQQE